MAPENLSRPFVTLGNHGVLVSGRDISIEQRDKLVRLAEGFVRSENIGRGWSRRMSGAQTERPTHSSRLSRAKCRNADETAFTTRVENAHGTGVREVLYWWHPWFGLDVHVHAAATKSEGVYFRCMLNGADGARWQELPAWMFDRTVCVGPCMLSRSRAGSCHTSVMMTSGTLSPKAMPSI